MTRALVVRRKAEHQARAARDWYEQRVEGLGDEFVAELDTALVRARRDPLAYQQVRHEIRRVLLRRFPYAVFFVVEPERVVVLAILRQSASPGSWPDP